MSVPVSSPTRAVVLAATALVPAPSHGQSAELRPHDPVVCQGTRRIEIRDRLIESDTAGVVSQGNCDIRIVGSHIIARGVGVLAQGRGRIEIADSTIEGRSAALVANGRAVITYENTTLRGAVQAQGAARIEGDDGGAAASAPPPMGGRTRIGAGGVRVEAEDGSSIDVGAAGVRMEGADQSEIRIGPGGIRLEVGAEGAADPAVVLAPDAAWRQPGGAASADADALIAQLGGQVDEGGLHLALAGDVLFDFSSEVVRPSAAAQLALVARLIRSSATGTVVIVGHTDSVGDEAANQRLSERRAESVMRWLYEHEGIPAAIMSGDGRGEREPVAHNTRPNGSDDPEGRARNRRVEVHFAVDN